MTDVKHCQEPVPEALAGGRNGLSCKLQAKPNGRPHDGNHKAHWSLRGVGRVTIMWKAKGRMPPVITLPRPTADHIQPSRGSVTR